MNCIGIVCDVKENKASVKLDNELTTDYLDVVQHSSNANSISFQPIKIGEQVLVIAVNDDINSGVILRGIYQDKHKLDASDTKEYVEFSDGTCISYDTVNSTLDINVAKTININCVDCNVICTNLNANANTTTITSQSINLVGNTNIAGGISTSGAGGKAGAFSINGSLEISGALNVKGVLSVDKNISTKASIIDSKGNLTNHTNSGYGRD
ncbi:phage baseplate assembly protein V [Campylobacter sp. RM9334]|uniref:phage baseplate assembly protein V n=1 Tax=Campylobacter sp. RM9334 TaxID=2735732 RepID=UPI001DAF1F37|nr:phage baseplate assembly protein V [Campylobacter sp. RM9334]